MFGALYWQQPIDITGGLTKVSLMYTVTLTIVLGTFQLINAIMVGRAVYYKQKSENFFPPWAYIVGDVLAFVPIPIFDIATFGTMAYFMPVFSSIRKRFRVACTRVYYIYYIEMQIQTANLLWWVGAQEWHGLRRQGLLHLLPRDLSVYAVLRGLCPYTLLRAARREQRDWRANRAAHLDGDHERLLCQPRARGELMALVVLLGQPNELVHPHACAERTHVAAVRRILPGIGR